MALRGGLGEAKNPEWRWRYIGAGGPPSAIEDRRWGPWRVGPKIVPEWRRMPAEWPMLI